MAGSGCEHRHAEVSIDRAWHGRRAYERAARGLTSAVIVALSLSACGEKNAYRPAAAAEGRCRAAAEAERDAVISLRPAIPRPSTARRWWRACRASSRKSTTRTAMRSRPGQACSSSSPSPTSSRSSRPQAGQASAEASVKAVAGRLRRASRSWPRKASPASQDSTRRPRPRPPHAAKQKQSAVDVKQAKLNLSYTEVKAPFDGIVTARAGFDGPACRRRQRHDARHHRPARPRST